MKAEQATPSVLDRQWPQAGATRVPYWAYSDPQVYRREMDVIFCGESWAYVGLGVEIPNPGDFKQVSIGDRPLVMCRDEAGGVHVFENRCAHRGVKFCREPWGSTKQFTCPYHLWRYDLKGNLRGLPFHHGVKQQGGMPDDFRREDHGLGELRVSTRGDAVFATFSPIVESFEDYLGPTFLALYDRMFDGRDLTLLGYTQQLIPSNWKLMFENLKDPYHASLMHVFLVTFGLFRADQQSAIKMDATGRHGALISMKGEQQTTADNAEMKNLRADLKLNDPRLVDPVREYPGQETVVMQTLWPNLILQQQSNTLAMRQLIPRGPEAFELAWTFFGYADDTEDMHLRRLRQANLMGPAGLVSVDDSEVMKLSQNGISPYPEANGFLEMGAAIPTIPIIWSPKLQSGRFTITTAASWDFDMSWPITLRFEIDDLFAAYAAALDGDALETWPDFFTDDGFYQVIPRDNYERGLPLALIRCESKGMLQDRVFAIRETMMYEPRYLRHLISGIRITGQDDGGWRVEANYAVFETPLNELSRVFNVGRYLDHIVRDGEQLKFAEKHCVFDSLLVPNSIVYPI